MKNRYWTVGLILIGSTFSAHAFSDYQCTIERIAIADVDSKALAAFESNFIGKQFSVDRKTGNMTGALKNSYVTKPQVIDFGSKENAFKAVTIMRKSDGAGKGSNIYALTINEYSESNRKPFVFLRNDETFFGTCEHF